MKGGESNITFVPSPVDIWRKSLRNVSLSSGPDAVYNTFIPLYVDKNIFESSNGSEKPGIDSATGYINGENTVKEKEDNYDDSKETTGSDSVGSQELPFTVKETYENDLERSSILKENGEDLNSSQVAKYLGVDVSEDVFYLLEK